ncbi:MAG TPA: TatD family hydrolase [Anaerolineae bacterium]|nr:TatD family hydrolase [Anaerolineae bacterium]
MELIDTHCHLDWNSFDPDREAVIDRAVQAGVARMITIGVDVPSSRRAIEIAEQHEAVLAAVGVHPNDCADFDAAMLQEIRSLAQHPKVVAIGEIGLDYYWKKVARDTQERTFRAQLELAAEINKPVIIHSRDAAPDVVTLLEDFAQRTHLTGTLHSYFDDLTIAQRAFAIGFDIGVTGPITFKKSDREREILRQVPLDRVLLETDAPFLTPVPHRGERNEPAYVRHVAEMIAQVWGQSIDDVARQSTTNAERLFGLG